MRYECYENIEGMGIWRNGDFVLKTVVNTGSKDMNQNRRDAFFLKTYDSDKYNNKPTLKRLTINPSSFLVMTSNRKDEDGNYLAPLSIYMSYKHIENFRIFITACYEELEANIDKIYLKNKISPKFEELIYESEPMVGGAKFSIYPEKIVNEETQNMYNGIVLSIEDEKDTVSTEVSFDHFWTLVKILERYDLLVESRELMIISMLHQLINNNLNNSNEDDEDGYSSKSYSKSSPKKLKNRNSSATRKPIRGKTIEDIMNEDEDEEEGEETVEEEIIETPKKVAKKPVKTVKTPSKKAPKKKVNIVDEDEEEGEEKPSISLNEMLDAGEKYEFNLEDEEEGELF